ncbi:hypothetical protein ACIBFB_12540 [Nocardiopsis sp. NPDC050513]
MRIPENALEEFLLGERAAEELRKARENGGDDDDGDPPLVGARV